MTINADELELIAQQVWQVIMGTEIARAPVTDDHLQEGPVFALVELSGAYSATVALQMHPSLVRRAAATMFGMEAQEVSTSEMEDTARELTHIIGGNIKCMVDQPTRLGLPEVTPASAFRAARDPAACRLAFEHQGAPFEVLVYDAPSR